MANQITTAADLRAVLDAIYDNRESYDTYQTMQLYYNEITRTAKIFSVTDDNTETIVAVFNPENVVTTDNAFICTLMKSTITYGDEVQVFDLGLGGYVSVNVLIKNICASLGVLINDTFIEANPQYYNDMVAIIKNRYGRALENQAPYVMKKGIDSQTDETYYKSYIPILCIVDIAIYLNNMGIFVSGDYKVLGNITPYSTCLLNGSVYNDSYNEMQIDFPTWADFDVSVMDKATFIDTFKKFFTQPRMIVSNENALITNGLNAFDRFLEQYETEIDWDNFIYGRWTQTTSSATNTETVSLFTYNLNDVFFQFSSDVSIANFQYAYNGKRSIKSDNTGYTVYTLTVSHNNTTQEDTITHNKSVYNVNKGFSDIGNNINVHNLKGDRIVKPYASPFSGEWFTVGSNRKFKPVDNYPQLNRNTEYNNLKFLTDERNFIPYNLRKILEKESVDLNIGENDYVLTLQRSYGSYGRKHVIIKIKDTNKGIKLSDSGANPTGAMFSINCNFMPVPDIQLRESGTWNEYNATELSWYQDVTTFKSSQSSIMNQKFTITENTDIEIYTIDINRVNNAYTYTYTYDTLNTNEFKINEYLTDGTYTVLSNNLGEMVEFGGGESGFEGLTIMDGADTPNDVIDLASFNTHYPDWNKIISWNPTLVNGVLQDTTATTTWGAVGITKDTPTSQESEQGGEIDFDDSDVVEDIIEDTDNATEDNDKADDEPDTGSDTNGGEDTGTTPDLPERADLVTPAYIKVYALTETQANNFLTEMLDPTAWEGFESAIFGNPMQYIIGLQTTEVYNGGGTTEAITTANHTFSTNGKRISGTSDVYVDINLGDLDIEPYYENYLDITNTTIQLYLPYIGFVDLDTSLVMDKTINLSARIYLITGDLLYTLKTTYDSSQGYSATHTIYQWSGNCQEEVPLSNDGSLMKSIGRSLLSFSDKINDGILARASKSIR